MKNQIESYFGCIHTQDDIKYLVNLCVSGNIGVIRRRLSMVERRLIRPGSIFIYCEYESGIKRWTDGMKWSVSRTSKWFIYYIESVSENRMIKKIANIVFYGKKFNIVSYQLYDDEAGQTCCYKYRNKSCTINEDVILSNEGFVNVDTDQKEIPSNFKSDMENNSLFF